MLVIYFNIQIKFQYQNIPFSLQSINLLLLSLQNTNSSTVSTSSLSLLTLNSQSPHVSDTSMQSDFLHSFQILSQLVGQSIRSQLRVFAILDILLSIQKPGGDFEVFRISHGGLDSFQFFGIDLTSSLVDIDFGFFQDQVGESSAHTLDGSQGIADFDVTIDVGFFFLNFYTTFSVSST